MIDDAVPAATLVGDATTLCTANGWTESVVLRATPFSVAVIVAERVVGTSTTLTLNVADDPVTLTLGGQVSPSPVHAMVAVCALGTVALSVNVIGT